MPRSRRPARQETAAIAAGTVLALVALAFATGQRAGDPPSVPDWLGPEMAALPAETRVLNDDLLGGPFMWMYSDLDFAYSGYGDTYTLDELRDKTDLFKLNPGWQDVLAHLETSYALLPPETRLGEALRTDLHWRVVHRSPELVMLAAPRTP